MITILNKLLIAMKENRTADMITLVHAPAGFGDCLGQMLIIYPDGQSDGLIISPETTLAIKEHIDSIEWTGPALIDIQKYSIRVFWNRTEQKRKAVIAGGGHISLPLSQILSLAGFEVTVIDDRPEFANNIRFPQAGHVICQDFTHAFSAVNIDADTAVIIVTRGHRYDLDCLQAVISSPARYLGMIGSRRRIRSIIDQMAKDGVSADALYRLKAPIGLDIGAQTPEEIAVSISAEVIAVFRGGTCLPLSSKAVIRDE